MQITKQLGAEIKAEVENAIEGGGLPGFTLDGYAVTYEGSGVLTLEENLDLLVERRDSYLEFASANNLRDATNAFVSQFIAEVERDLRVVYNAREIAKNEAPVGNDTKPTGEVIAHSDAIDSTAIDSKSTQSSVETDIKGDTDNGKKQTRKQQGDTNAGS